MNKSFSVQSGDGTAVAAGYVGEVKEASNSSVTATYGGAAQTISSVSLGTGVWFVCCNISAANGVRPSSGIGASQIAINSNGSDIQTLTQLFVWYAAADSRETECFGQSISSVVNVPAASTYTVAATLAAIANSGTPTNYTCISRAAGKLQAIRIA